MLVILPRYNFTIIVHHEFHLAFIRGKSCALPVGSSFGRRIIIKAVRMIFVKN